MCIQVCEPSHLATRPHHLGIDKIRRCGIHVTSMVRFLFVFRYSVSRPTKCSLALHISYTFRSLFPLNGAYFSNSALLRHISLLFQHFHSFTYIASLYISFLTRLKYCGSFVTCDEFLDAPVEVFQHARWEAMFLSSRTHFR